MGILTILVPCRSAWAYDLQGEADPNDPEHLTWVLPPDRPVVTTCCIQDHDCDHLADWAEAELAWAFRPYVEFHHEEETGWADDHLILYAEGSVGILGGTLTAPLEVNPLAGLLGAPGAWAWAAPIPRATRLRVH